MTDEMRINIGTKNSVSQANVSFPLGCEWISAAQSLTSPPPPPPEFILGPRFARTRGAVPLPRCATLRRGGSS